MTFLPRSRIAFYSLLLIFCALPLVAEVKVEILSASVQVVPTKTTVPKVVGSTAVILPFFRAQVTDPAGETTFFAVRNNHSNAVTVRLSYYSALGIVAVTSDVSIPARGVLTRDLRAVQGLVSSNGIATGSVVVEALGDNLPSEVISGDYFRVNPAEAAANGGALVPLGETACKRWSHRLLDGGAFNGGTRLSVLALDTPAEGAALSGNVFNEDGQLVSVIAVTADEVAFELTGEELQLPVDFGSIDWVFSGDGHGTIAVTYSALGQFSVGAEAACLDVGP